MSGLRWVWGLVVAVLMVWRAAEFLGPFRLDAGERPPEEATRGQRVRAWCAGWRRRPRGPLSIADWLPHDGRMFLPSILAVGLVYCGGWVLFGHDQTFRLGGALALSAGIPLLMTIVGYVSRPVGVLPASPVGSTFPTAWPGYQAGEVDRVFAELGSMSRDDIEGVRFGKAAPGYEMDAVDRALEQAARSRLT